MPNTTAVVTGASTGIGEALTLRLASDGWTVIAVARRQERLTRIAGTATGVGRVIPLQADLSDLNALEGIGSRIREHTTEVHLLANIAGVWHGQGEAYYGPRIWELPNSQIVEVMNVGIIAPILLARAVIPLMSDLVEPTQIVNLSGTFNSGGAGWVHYFTSKRALEQLTFALADELKGHNVRVNCVSPADTASEEYIRFFPEDAADALAPDEVANFIVRLGQQEMRRINGQIIELRA